MASSHFCFPLDDYGHWDNYAKKDFYILHGEILAVMFLYTPRELASNN